MPQGVAPPAQLRSVPARIRCVHHVPCIVEAHRTRAAAAGDGDELAVGDVDPAALDRKVAPPSEKVCQVQPVPGTGRPLVATSRDWKPAGSRRPLRVRGPERTVGTGSVHGREGGQRLLPERGTQRRRGSDGGAKAQELASASPLALPRAASQRGADRERRQRPPGRPGHERRARRRSHRPPRTCRLRWHARSRSSAYGTLARSTPVAAMGSRPWPSSSTSLDGRPRRQVDQHDAGEPISDLRPRRRRARRPAGSSIAGDERRPPAGRTRHGRGNAGSTSTQVPACARPEPPIAVSSSTESCAPAPRPLLRVPPATVTPASNGSKPAAVATAVSASKSCWWRSGTPPPRSGRHGRTRAGWRAPATPAPR